MTSDEATVKVIDALGAVGLPYMVVGSLSVNFYGVARSTHDADFVVQIGRAPLDQLVGRLGEGFRLDPQLTFESVTGTTRHTIHVDEPDFTIEVFDLSTDPHDQERFRRRVPADLHGRPTYVPTAEDVLVTKLRWAVRAKRTKDMDDIANVIAVQQGSLDLPYIRKWCDEHGTRELFEQILAASPDI